MTPLECEIEVVSSPGDGVALEDIGGHCVCSTHIDVWVIDGATPISETAFVPGEQSDAAWYARLLSDYFTRASPETAGLDHLLTNAINLARETYAAAVGGLKTIPSYAWPLAALSIVRARLNGQFVLLSGCHLGDCTALLAPAVGAHDAIWDPQTHQAEKDRLRGLSRAQALGVLRARRAEQHANPASAIAGFDPLAVQFAGRSQRKVNRGSRLLLCSDGATRLFKEYALWSVDRFVTGAAHTPNDVIKALRQAERQGVGATLYKGCDDATIVRASFE